MSNNYERLRYRINDRIANGDRRCQPRTRNREWAERMVANLEAVLDHDDLAVRLNSVLLAISSRNLIETVALRAVKLIGESLTSNQILVGCRADRWKDKDFRMFSFETTDPAFEDKIRDFIMPILVPKIVEMMHHLESTKEDKPKRKGSKSW